METLAERGALAILACRVRPSPEVVGGDIGPCCSGDVAGEVEEVDEIRRRERGPWGRLPLLRRELEPEEAAADEESTSAARLVSS